MSGGTSAGIWRFTSELLCIVLRIAPAALSTRDQNLLGCRKKKGLFSLAGDVSDMPSWQFWHQFGQEAPTLRKLAMRVLSKVCLSRTFPHLLYCWRHVV